MAPAVALAMKRFEVEVDLKMDRCEERVMVSRLGWKLSVCLGGVGILWGGVMATQGFGFGEPRPVPDTSYYFDNFNFDRFPYGTVGAVLSGDTVAVQIDGETQMRIVRLAGIQAPEETDAPFDSEAVQLLRDRILFQQVKLEGDTFLRNEDASGPVEAYIWLHGDQMNALLVRNGLATIRPYTHNIKYDNHFVGLERRAREESLGIWSL